MTMRSRRDAEPTAVSPGSPRGANRLTLRTRRLAFAVICLVCVFATVAYVFKAITRTRSTKRPQERTTVSSVTRGIPAQTAGPLIIFTNLTDDVRTGSSHRYRAAFAPMAAPNDSRALTGLSCERMYFAGGRGLCLGEGGGTTSLEDGVSATHAYVFDQDFHITHDISLGGVPSRVRVSPDGRHGAATVFVAGHSYADAAFSTATTLIDLESGRRLGNLETFAVMRDGRPFRSIDFNFWGVTFLPDSDRFYATLGSGGRTYLVEGSVSARRMQTLRANAECPSASPDGSHVAFKARVTPGAASGWRFHVLDLTTMKETPLAELRSIDDQIEWLDSRRVMYGDGNAIWMANADGTGTPRKLLSQASSPAVVREEGIGRRLASAATTVLTLPVVDLAIHISPSAGNVSIDGLVTYTMTVTNNGPGDASRLKVEEMLGPGLTPVGWFTVTNPGQGYGCSHYDDPGHLSCDTEKLARGEVWTLSFNARATSAGTQTVQVLISGAEADPDPRNDWAEARTTVSSPSTTTRGGGVSIP